MGEEINKLGVYRTRPKYIFFGKPVVQELHQITKYRICEYTVLTTTETLRVWLTVSDKATILN